MEILRYTQFVKESDNSIMDQSEGMEVIEDEYLRMISEGLSEEQINENIFSSVLSYLGSGFKNVLTDYIVDWVVERLGIDAKDENGEPTYFYRVIRDVIEEIHYTELGSYFGKGSCKNWATALVRGFAKSLEEETLGYLLPRLGLKINTTTGLTGTITTALQKSLENSANDTSFMLGIENTISSKICGFNIGDILKGRVSSGDKAKITSEIKGAETKDPGIFAKAMKSGLSDVIGLTVGK